MFSRLPFVKWFQLCSINEVPRDLVSLLHRNYKKFNILRRIGEHISISLLTTCTKLLLCRHHVKIINKKSLDDLYHHRPGYVPLLTFTNHHSCMDDFLLFSAIHSFRDLLNIEKLRWSITATDVCFCNPFSAYLFKLGKGIPVFRSVFNETLSEKVITGLGVHQESITFASELLKEGKWVHIYPQGRIIMPYERDRETEFRLRWGTGRLMAENPNAVILPIYHIGADNIAPLDTPYSKSILRQFYRGNEHFTVVVGNPIEYDASKYKLTSDPVENEKIYAQLTEIAQSHLYKLKERAEALHFEHVKETRRETGNDDKSLLINKEREKND